MTRGELIFELSRSYGLDDTVGSDELLLMQTWLQRGVIDVLEKTHCYLDIGDMTLAAGVSDYRLDSTILAMNNIHITPVGGQGSQIDVIDMADLDRYVNANLVGGPPCFASIDGTFMRLAPAPATADVIRYYYVPRPSNMIDDNSDPSNPVYGGIPVEYHDAILLYGDWLAAQYNQQGGGFWRGHAYGPGAAQEGTYSGRIGEIKKSLRKKAGRGLHRGRIGYPDFGIAGRRNDQYPYFSENR